MRSQVSTTRRQFLITILRQILTPTEVVDWFGCGQGKKNKNKKNRKNSFGQVNKRFGLLLWEKKCISVRVAKVLLNRDPVRPRFESW